MDTRTATKDRTSTGKTVKNGTGNDSKNVGRLRVLPHKLNPTCLNSERRTGSDSSSIGVEEHKGRPNSGHLSDSDSTDSKPTRPRCSPKQVVSLNLNSKNNPLHPEKLLEGILPGGRPKILYGECDEISSGDRQQSSTVDVSNEKTHSDKSSSKIKSSIDDEFREKVKRMDYNTVYMMAQRTKGPQQYKYRKILQEMYDEQNK